MASKKRPKPGEKNYGTTEFRGFVKVYLKPQHKEAIKADLLTPEAYVDFVERTTDSGYKLTFSRSADGKTATATAYCTDFRLPNAGLGMSLRHGDFITAVSALRWALDFYGLNTDWDAVFGSEGDDDW